MNMSTNIKECETSLKDELEKKLGRGFIHPVHGDLTVIGIAMGGLALICMDRSKKLHLADISTEVLENEFELVSEKPRYGVRTYRVTVGSGENFYIYVDKRQSPPADCINWEES
jgi:hypothetical protein